MLKENTYVRFVIVSDAQEPSTEVTRKFF